MGACGSDRALAARVAPALAEHVQLLLVTPLDLPGQQGGQRPEKPTVVESWSGLLCLLWVPVQ